MSDNDDESATSVDLSALAAGIAAARLDAPPEPVALSVTSYVHQYGAAAAYRAEFDNTTVREGHYSTLGVVQCERIELPCLGSGVSPGHDVYVRTAVALAGLGVVITAAEHTILPLEWVAPTTRAAVRITGRVDVLARTTPSASVTESYSRDVIIEFKTSGSTEDEEACWRDLLRRTYIQQAQLYALARYRATGLVPACVWLVALPSDMIHRARPLHACRACIDYDPALWLKNINRELSRFQRYNGEPAAPCDTSLFADMPDEWFS
jgi:hypothetical protein